MSLLFDILLISYIVCILMIVVPVSEINPSNIGYILIIYSLVKILGAFTPNLSRWLRVAPQGGEVSGFFRERTNSLTLAGFSMTALTLFLTIATAQSTIHYKIIDTVFYLSISLVCFIISSYVVSFGVNRIYSYACTTIEVIGLLSVGIALLLFFIENVIDNSNMQNIQTVYWILFGAIIVIAFLEVRYQHLINFPAT
jgi:hypothetical protein